MLSLFSDHCSQTIAAREQIKYILYLKCSCINSNSNIKPKNNMLSSFLNSVVR